MLSRIGRTLYGYMMLTGAPRHKGDRPGRAVRRQNQSFYWSRPMRTLANNSVRWRDLWQFCNNTTYSAYIFRPIPTQIVRVFRLILQKDPIFG